MVQYKSQCKKALATFSETTSIHGFGWYQKTQNGFLKVLLILSYLTIFIALPTLIGLEFRDLILNPKISTSITHEMVEEAKYPVITICHPSFFDLEELQS